MMISNGDWTVFFTGTASLGFLILALVAFVAPILLGVRRRRRAAKMQRHG